MKKYIIILIVIFAIIGGWFFFSHNKIDKNTLDEAILQTYQATQDEKDFAKMYQPAKIEVAITEQVTHEILKYNSESVTVNIKAPNMREVFDQIASPDVEIENGDEEYNRIVDFVLQSLEKKDFSYMETTVTLPITNEDGVIEIEKTEEYTDAVLGGLLSYFEEIDAMAEREGAS